MDFGRVETWHGGNDDDNTAFQETIRRSMQDQGPKPRKKEKEISIDESRNVERGKQRKPPEDTKGRGKNIVYE